MSKTTQEFVLKVVNDAAGMVAIRLCAIGNHLGVFKNLSAEGPATSEELAARMGLSVERADSAVATLSGAELNSLAQQANAVDTALAGGASTIVISTTTVIIVLLLLILLLK